MEILRHEGVETVDVKRLYLPYTIKDPCPKCGVMSQRNLSLNDYLSYPKLGLPYQLSGYCQECDHEWDIKVVLEMVLTDPDKKTLTVELTEGQLSAIRSAQSQNGESLGDTLVRMAGLHGKDSSIEPAGDTQTL